MALRTPIPCPGGHGMYLCATPSRVLEATERVLPRCGTPFPYRKVGKGGTYGGSCPISASSADGPEEPPIQTPAASQIRCPP